MAKALGISHPVLSRVLRARQEPPGKLLEALARWPGVNVRWLFAGEGEPLGERNLWAGGGRFLPIADRLLPGPPGAHPEMLTWTSLPVADALYSDTAYWFRVPREFPITRAKKAAVRAGDYLLVETAARWAGRLDGVRGRLCALRVAGSGTGELVLGEVGRDAELFSDPEYHPVDTFGRHADGRLYPEESAVPGEGRGGQEVHFRLSDVVGVCVKLDRVL